MRIGAFEVFEDEHRLVEPHALVSLSPWVDVGEVGETTLGMMEKYLHARPLGELTRPGDFFDFTRYRPEIRLTGGKRTVVVPNSYINYARRLDGRDFLFLHLLEPHMRGEDYVESVIKVLKAFGVTRYYLIGSMYDVVPHTRPLLLSGYTTGPAKEQMRRLGVQPSDYQGPTTIAALVTQKGPRLHIEVTSVVVHLPQYVKTERDYNGVLRLMELLSSLYELPINLDKLRHKAEAQNRELDEAVEKEPQLRLIVQEMERLYDSRARAEKPTEPELALSPEIEQFLRDATRRFGQD